jgi:ATP-dependent Lon protease
MRRAIISQFDQYVKLNKKIPPEILSSLSGIEDPGRLADTIAAHLPLKLEQKQEILEMFDAGERLERLLNQLETELDILQVESASVAASSARWRRASASTTSTNRSRPSRRSSAKARTAPISRRWTRRSRPPA